jgi:hypothetical protein
MGDGGQSLTRDRHAMRSPHSRPDRRQQRPCTDDIHHSHEIVGEQPFGDRGERAAAAQSPVEAAPMMEGPA